MNTRIEHIVYTDGTERFYPQQVIFRDWRYFKSNSIFEGSYSLFYDTVEEARKFLNNLPVPKETKYLYE